MKFRSTVYWVTTALVAAELVWGGVLDLTHQHSVVVTLHQLGYPTYLLTILGMWRLPAAAVLLAPRLPRLKEWAYAGTFFELTGASLSSLAVGGSLGAVVAPLLVVACAVVSWASRPQSRMLGPVALPGVRVWRRADGSTKEPRRARS